MPVKSTSETKFWRIFPASDGECTVHVVCVYSTLDGTNRPVTDYSEAEFLDVTGTKALKGPKREIYGLRIFAQIRPIWIGYLGTRPKNPKKLRLGPYIALYFLRFLC